VAYLEFQKRDQPRTLLFDVASTNFNNIFPPLTYDLDLWTWPI